MPTVFSHAAFGFGSATLAAGTRPASSVIVAASLLAALPDADALFIGTIPYGDPLGHRGLTHSLFFAAATGVIAAFVLSRAGWAGEIAFARLALIFSLVMGSHGFFDAMTDGGLGIAFFAPFDNTRYFFPWRPIPVAPLSLHGLATERGADLLAWESGMFWTFAAGAAFWDRQAGWKRWVAIGFWVAAAVVWIVALIARAR